VGLALKLGVLVGWSPWTKAHVGLEFSLSNSGCKEPGKKPDQGVRRGPGVRPTFGMANHPRRLPVAAGALCEN